MTEGHRQRRWLVVFPRGWRDRYGAELDTLVDDLRGEGDLRSSDRIDIVRAGLATRTRALRRRSLSKVLGPALAAAAVLVGLALAGTFTPPQSARSPSQTQLGVPFPGQVVVLHAHATGFSPAQKAIIFCTAAPATGQVTACRALSAHHVVPHGTDQPATVRFTVALRQPPRASRDATAADR